MSALIDIGANLTHDSFDKDRDAVIARAFAVGVKKIIVTGTSVDGSREALNLAGQFPGKLFATAGVHPHHAKDFDPATAARIRELATDAVAIGECGLDFFRDYSPREDQLVAFEEQLKIAAEIGKPVFLHQRDAHEPFADLLHDYMPRIAGGVAHCFTGNKAELTACLDMGLYIGITGWICDERRAGDLRQAVKRLPLDRVLLETDAPYLLPRDLKDKPSGRRNEPSLLPHILETTAHYMGRPAAAVAEAAARNAEHLFKLPVEPSSSPPNGPGTSMTA